MKVWIDTLSGTWGNTESLKVVDLGDSELHDKETDEVSLVLFLEDASDAEIAEFGLRYGKEV